jgi:hypothetical protein
MPKGKAKQEPGGEKVNKLGAMRQVIQELGANAENSAIRAALTSDFGVSMTPGMFSNYKSFVMKEMGAGKRTSKPKAKVGSAPAAYGRKGKLGDISVEDIVAVKELIDRLGADQVEQLARVLGE